ncbi:dolichol-phosphate mannosyltransferase subunit 3 [Parasteatoda tepidariorum]|uniref:Dolichol-phosphate mannosyltransferase subunit 3 n=1 Tax=Parasteatoda tepidariorum TaxID=114398 RepID=A0A2L2YEW3_PARTP|nr:dolichol-phosphate mannosyltransferase subunit 3 [Parasteatoda tepidariorum]
MTKLAEWFTGLFVVTGIWYSCLTNNIILNNQDWHSWLVPLYGVIAFGIYSLFVVLYRVYTFNDCPEAAEELKMEIKQAKEDLKKRGFKFEQ